MLAVVLTEQNKPLEVLDLQWGELQVGQVLVRVYAAGICGAQVGEITGAKGPDPYLPHLLGHEGAGVVVDIGPGVSTLSRGDHVVLHWRKGQGIEASAPVYTEKSSGKKIGAGLVATWAEYAIVSENRCTKIDKDIPFDVACLLGCAVTTGLGLITNEAKLQIGQSILVFGVGGVGLNVVQGAAMVSSHPVSAVDVCPKKLELAKQLGATNIWLSSNASEEELLSPTIGRKGYDVVVDCTGNPSIIEFGLNLTRPGGKLLLVGQPKHDQDLNLRSFRKHYCGKTLMDCQGGLTNPSEDIPKYLNIWKAGKLVLHPLITQRRDLTQTAEAIQEIIDGKVAGRCILTMD